MSDSVPEHRSRLEELLARAQERAQLQAAEEVTAQSPARSRSPDVVARLLAERGFWALTPASQLELFEVEDIHGSLQVIPSAQGASGVREAIVFTGLVSLWADGARDSPEIVTSTRALAEQLCMSWGGETGEQIKQAIGLLRRTHYCFQLQDPRAGWDQDFTLLHELETAWSGPPTSPHRHIRAVFHPVVFEQLRDRRNIRPIDLEVLRRLGPQRELARRLFLLLEALPAHALDPEFGRRREIIERLVDHRLSGSLGSTARPAKLVEGLKRAGAAIVDAAPRYETIEVAARGKRNLAVGDPRNIIRVVRARVVRAR